MNREEFNELLTLMKTMKETPLFIQLGHALFPFFLLEIDCSTM